MASQNLEEWELWIFQSEIKVPHHQKAKPNNRKYFFSGLYTFTAHPCHLYMTFSERTEASVISLVRSPFTKVIIELDAWFSFPQLPLSNPVSLWCAFSFLFWDYHWAWSREWIVKVEGKLRSYKDNNGHWFPAYYSQRRAFHKFILFLCLNSYKTEEGEGKENCELEFNILF